MADSSPTRGASTPPSSGTSVANADPASCGEAYSITNDENWRLNVPGISALGAASRLSYRCNQLASASPRLAPGIVAVEASPPAAAAAAARRASSSRVTNRPSTNPMPGTRSPKSTGYGTTRAISRRGLGSSLAWSVGDWAWMAGVTTIRSQGRTRISAASRVVVTATPPTSGDFHGASSRRGVSAW